jgi:2-polyprenyl-3-methyl-5-hydroxy-6-metoxy-1,4-benzoquinol methylase
MGYLTIESENPDLSWVLGKNPDSGMICRTIRSGILYGWYHNNQTYVIRFIDCGDEVSFRKNIHDNYNYLNALQYCSPLFLSSIVTEIFGSTMNKSNEKDVVCKNKITHHLIKLNSRSINFINKLNRHIKNFNINIIPTQYTKLYKLEIESDCLIKDIINYSYMLGNIINVLSIGYVDKPRLEQLEKMINFMIQINVPYYPRYLLKTNLISFDEFNKLKDKLETFGDEKIKMYWGNSQVQRFNFVNSHISFSSDIIDFGCGEGYYVKGLMPKLSKTCKYYAWDADSEELEKVKYFKEKNPEYENLIILDSEEKLFNQIKYDNPTILLSEVFEHIEKEKAVELVNKIKSTINFSQMIITTPDVGFNKHYFTDGEISLRHHDHKQEYTQEEFKEIIENIFGEQFEKNFYNVGDQIENNSITQSYVIKSNIQHIQNIQNIQNI